MKLILYIIIFAKNLRLHGIGQGNICFIVKHYLAVNISDRFTLNFVSQNLPRKAWSPRYYFVRIHDILVCKVLHIRVEVRGKSLTQCSALKHDVHICQRLSSCSRQPHTIATVSQYCTVLYTTPVYRLQCVERRRRDIRHKLHGSGAAAELFTEPHTHCSFLLCIFSIHLSLLSLLMVLTKHSLKYIEMLECLKQQFF